MQAAVIGLDLGTTGCKCSVFSEELQVLGEASIEYPLIRISPSQIEQDAQLWWDLVKRSIKQSISRSGIKADAIKAIGISSQGISFIPTDENYMPLDNAISWLDTRATRQRDHILESYSQSEIFSITGKRVNEYYTLPKLIWLKENKPLIYEKAYKLLMALDYITAKLCGECVTDHTMASGTLLYDVSKQQWASGLLNHFDIDTRKLPDIRWSGSTVGKLRKTVALELGMADDVVLAVGGQDQKCAALGAGIDKNIISISLGTASGIEQKCNRPVLDKQMQIPCFSWLFRNDWVIEGCIPTAGAALKWMHDTLFSGKSYSDLDDMVCRSMPGKNRALFYPHLAGAGTPYLEHTSGGTIHGITLSTSPHEIVRSVYEGIAYQIRANLDIMQGLLYPINEIRLYGGGTKNEAWRQIIADITGKAVKTLSSCETASAGAAMLAGIACGIFDSSKLQDLIKTAEVSEPNGILVKEYDCLYYEYLDIQKRIFDA